MDVEFGAHSRRGPQRSVNEDHYLVLRLQRRQETLLTSLPEQALPRHFDEFGYGMVVADGMGGTGAGEAASRLAVTTLVSLAVYFGKWNVRIDAPIASEVIDRIERFYRGVDATLVEASKPGTPELRSTLTALFSAGRDLFYAHVGHSRAYVFRDEQLLRLTRDHTFDLARARMVPLINVSESARDLRHILTDAIGSSAPGGPQIDVERCALASGDVVLLCTNGLTDAVDETAIARVLGSPYTPDEQCRQLVNLAAHAATEDDVTALVARYRFLE